MIMLVIPLALIFGGFQEGKDVRPRWRFTEDASKPEKKSHARSLKKIDAWWKAFERRCGDLDAHFSQSKEMDVPGFMEKALQSIHPHIMWEFGPAVKKKGHRLVITCEVRRDLRPLVNVVLSRAPKLDKWEFYGYRLPESFEQSKGMVKARTGGDISKTFFVAEVNKFNAIDLTFYSESYDTEDRKRSGSNDVFVAIESLLGEEVLEKWIGNIELVELGASVKGHKHIRELQSHVTQLTDKTRNGLPDKPHYKLANDTKWTMFELKPKEQKEYVNQEDMFVGKSMNAQLWKNAHSGIPFDSIRYSKRGEIFCYLKLDGSTGLDEEKFKDKAAIEDALDAALEKAGLGCHIGGGTGKKYSYIDLALTDIDKAIPVIRKVLREGKISKRSWLLFFDSDLQSEWVGIWDDTPAPPMNDPESEK